MLGCLSRCCARRAIPSLATEPLWADSINPRLFLSTFLRRKQHSTAPLSVRCPSLWGHEGNGDRVHVREGNTVALALLEALHRYNQTCQKDVVVGIGSSIQAGMLVSETNAHVSTSVAPPAFFEVLGRNSRRAKRANKGKRPCSRIRRRAKKRQWGNTRR